MARSPPAFALVLALVSAALPAAAGEPAAELYASGLENMLAGRYEAGCPKIEESHRLEPLPGTLFTLAECEAKRGRLATALRHYQRYLVLYAALPPEKQARQRGREKIAAEQELALGRQAPLLTLKLPDGAPSGTVVRRDGETLDTTTLGVPLPMDPGEHVVTAQAPGGSLIELRFKLTPGQKKTLLIAAQAPEPALKPPEPALKPPAIDGRKIGLYATGGLAIAAIVTGTVTGGLALAEKATISANCQESAGPSVTCNGRGKAAAEQAKTLAAASTASFGVGLGGLAVATILYLVAAPPSGKPPQPVPGKKKAATQWTWTAVATPAQGGAMGLEARGTW